MRQLTIEDLENLSLGSSVLGSGGGGDPAYALMMAKYQIELYGLPTLISIGELKADDLIVPLSMMGAPLIGKERLPSGEELDILLQTIEKRLGRSPTVLMAAEIGGANSFTPLLIAARWGLPILDADMMGRAFPELQMSSCYLKGLNATPAVMADCLGNCAVLETTDAATLEKMARALTVSMGSYAAIGFYLMSGREVPGSVVSGSFSFALRIGKTLTETRALGNDPIYALAEVSDAELLGRGTLIEIDQVVKDGFLQGSVAILTERGKITLTYQNEYLLAKRGDEVLASTPDLLVLLEEKSGTPVTSEALKYGLQVALLAIPSPSIWQSPEGLNLVGPEAFGYAINYQSLERISK